MNQYTAIIVKYGDWYAGTIKELSGVHSQAKTKEELKANLVEAIQLIIEANKRHFIGDNSNYTEEKLLVNIRKEKSLLNG